MFDFFKRNKDKEAEPETPKESPAGDHDATSEAPSDSATPQEKTFFDIFRRRKPTEETPPQGEDEPVSPVENFYRQQPAEQPEPLNQPGPTAAPESQVVPTEAPSRQAEIPPAQETAAPGQETPARSVFSLFKREKAADTDRAQETAPVELPLPADRESGPYTDEVPAPAAEGPDKGMFNFFRSEKPAEAAPEEAGADTGEKQGFFARLKAGLTRTRENFVNGLDRLTLGKKQIDDELLEDLEALLLSADIGLEATTEILANVTERVRRKDLIDPQALTQAIREALLDILRPRAQPWQPNRNTGTKVLMMVGINGAGKTTTIGKLAALWQAQDIKVVMAAGDTFRAAAVEQLQQWGQRVGAPVIAQHSGADSASVIYDGFAAARSRNADLLIADTAGRLHTQTNLMEELKKVKRVLGKLDPEAPQEIWLVIDASTGQNALNQAKQFHEAVGLTGICVTKLDGTAKGGVIAAVAKNLPIPIRYIGVGERPEDLRPFDAEAFVDALFSPPATK